MPARFVLVRWHVSLLQGNFSFGLLQRCFLERSAADSTKLRLMARGWAKRKLSEIFSTGRMEGKLTQGTRCICRKASLPTDASTLICPTTAPIPGWAAREYSFPGSLFVLPQRVYATTAASCRYVGFVVCFSPVYRVLRVPAQDFLPRLLKKVGLLITTLPE